MSDRVDLPFQIGRLILVFGDIRLTPGVGQHQLAFPFTHSAAWLEHDTTANSAVLLGARLYSTAAGTKWVGDVPSRIFTTPGYQVSDELALPLTDSQLFALDAERRNGDLRLQIDLTGTVLHVPGGIHPSMDAQLSLFVQSAAWLKCLDQVGSELGITIRVPSPLVDPGAVPPLPPSAGAQAVASRAQATARLRQARMELTNG
jgi:hypothetical protein